VAVNISVGGGVGGATAAAAAAGIATSGACGKTLFKAFEERTITLTRRSKVEAVAVGGYDLVEKLIRKLRY
jgi:uncharacterized protein (DUF697 family)